MKKKRTSALIVLLIIVISLTTVVSAVSLITWPGWGEDSRFTVRVNVEKGWNTIPLGFEPGEETHNSEIKKEDIVASYWYINEFNEYVELYPNNRFSEELEKRGFYSYWDDNNAAYIMNSAVWVYSNKAGLLEFNSFDSMFPLESGNVKLRSGWNFVAITPDMVGKKIEEFKGTCEVQKVYAFEPTRQTWINLINEEMQQEAIGLGIVIKVPSDCTLREARATLPSIPDLPSESSPEISCTDSDNGKDYYSKGSVKTVKYSHSFWDNCGTPSAVSYNIKNPGDYVVEAYCESNGEVAFAKYECPNGCNDGACIY
jgi:hypothetical protein